MQSIKCQIVRVPTEENPAIVVVEDMWFGTKDVVPNPIYSGSPRQGYHLHLKYNDEIIASTDKADYFCFGMIDKSIFEAYINSNGTLEEVECCRSTDSPPVYSLVVLKKDTFTRDEVLDLLTLHEFKDGADTTLDECKRWYPKSFASRRKIIANWLNKTHIKIIFILLLVLSSCTGYYQYSDYRVREVSTNAVSRIVADSTYKVGDTIRDATNRIVIITNKYPRRP